MDRAAALITLLVAAPAMAERCATSTLALHCVSRCAGLDNASATSSNPPPEQVLGPPNAELLAQLENEAKAPKRRGLSLFAQLAEGANSNNFTDQTVYAPAHRALTPDQVMALVGPAAAIEWVPVRRAAFGCVDGRYASGGLYAYGGDLGEFALALSVLEHVGQRPIGQAETTQLLEGWLRQLNAAGGGVRERPQLRNLRSQPLLFTLPTHCSHQRSFHLLHLSQFGACVDAAAAAALASTVGLPELDLSAPPEEARAALMLRLVAPEFVGSEHIKWLLHYPKTYATRRTLIEQLVRSFYGILWNVHHPAHDTVKLDALYGQRAERAVVHVHTSHWCAAEQGLAPNLPSKSRGGSFFVYHPDAVAARRDALVRYLAGVVSPPIDRAEFGGRVRTLGDGQAALTEKSLAGMLRSYSLMVK